jgi:hypothetical protein
MPRIFSPLINLILPGLGLVLFASAAFAAPPTKVNLIYEATRNGQPFATVTETFVQKDGRYKIESITKGLGIYALFGERRLTSEGEVTADGLKPSHFELHQGDSAKRSLFADFDWAANVLKMKVKGEPRTAPLQKGSQDLSSFVYQFMFVQPKGEDFLLPVTTGKKLRTYHYKVVGRDIPLDVPAGKFKTIHMKDAGEDAAEDQKELWLGTESHFLPVRLTMVDEGTKIVQTLTSLRAE